MSSEQRALINGLQVTNNLQQEAITTASGRARQAEFDRDRAAHHADIAQMKLDNALARIKSLEDENEHYQNLLCLPMKEIARQNGDFKKTYEQQQQILAEWILSQRAYKEVAISLGLETGMQPDDIKQLATQTENAVLHNQTQHGNNSTSSPLLGSLADQIIAMRKKNTK